MLRRRVRGSLLPLLPLLVVCAPQSYSARHCRNVEGLRGTDRGSVNCKLTSWKQLNLSRFNLSEIVRLTVSIREESAPLTAAPLKGLVRLKSLMVKGTCHDKGKRKNTIICKDVRGLSWTEAGAFQKTPALTSLILQIHPMHNLSLDGLSKLQYLFLSDLNNLRELPAAVMDPVRASMTYIDVKHTMVKGVLPDGLFYSMGRLSTLKWDGRLRRIEGGAIAHLPKLSWLDMTVSVNICDCGVLDLIRWANRNGQSSKLIICCENYRNCTCEQGSNNDNKACRKKGRKSYPYQDLGHLANVLSPQCNNPTSTSTTPTIDSNVVRAQPDLFLLLLGLVVHLGRILFPFL